MQKAFEMLVEPQRRRILELLLEQPRSTGELVELLGLSQPGTSKHLRLLREAGFVVVEPRGQQRIYSLAAAPFNELAGWLDRYRNGIAANLDALGAYLETASATAASATAAAATAAAATAAAATAAAESATKEN